MQNQSLSAQICSVGQGRIYLVHLQLARGVVKGVFVERGGFCHAETEGHLQCAPCPQTMLPVLNYYEMNTNICGSVRGVILRLMGGARGVFNGWQWGELGDKVETEM